MDFKKLSDQAKKVVDKRGGTESVKEDAQELKGIFSGKGSLSDKAKAAAEAIKDPGAKGQDEPAAAEAGKPEGAGQAKHGHEHDREGQGGQRERP